MGITIWFCGNHAAAVRASYIFWPRAIGLERERTKDRQNNVEWWLARSKFFSPLSFHREQGRRLDRFWSVVYALLHGAWHDCNSAAHVYLVLLSVWAEFLIDYYVTSRDGEARVVVV